MDFNTMMHTPFKDWAGNQQTLYSTLQHLDSRLTTLTNLLAADIQSRVPEVGKHKLPIYVEATHAEVLGIKETLKAHSTGEEVPPTTNP